MKCQTEVPGYLGQTLYFKLTFNRLIRKIRFLIGLIRFNLFKHQKIYSISHLTQSEIPKAVIIIWILLINTP
jgi:hypothetical protein